MNKSNNIIRIIIWILIILSILLITSANWRNYYNGMGNDLFFKLNLIGVVSAVFWTFTLKLKKSTQTNLVTLFVSLIIGIYLIELMLNITNHLEPKKDRSTIAQELGVKFDNRSKIELIEDLKKSNINAVPTFFPSQISNTNGFTDYQNATIYPLGGMSNRTTVYNNESGEYLIYKSDRFGFNNPNNEWDTSQLKWLLVGDSFVHGSAVNPKNNIAGQLRSITGESVINIGMGGNGPLIELASLKEYGEKLKPKRVLWIYYEGNDLDDLLREEKNDLLKQYMIDNFSQKLLEKQQHIDKKINEFILNQRIKGDIRAKMNELGDKTKWLQLNLVKQMIKKYGNSSEFDSTYKKSIVKFSKIISLAKSRVESWGGQLYFVYLPEFYRYKDQVNHNSFKKKSEIKKLIKNLNIQFIDIDKEVFRKESNPKSLFPFEIHGHYNARGYNKVAKTIIHNAK